MFVGSAYLYIVNPGYINNSGATYSEPFIVEQTDYLQGNFFEHPKTIITTDTGATMVLDGIVLVPESGVEVMIRDSLGIITIVKVGK